MSSTESLPERLLRLCQSVKSTEANAPLTKKRKVAGCSTRSAKPAQADVEVDKDFHNLLNAYKEQIDRCGMEQMDKQDDFLEFKDKIDELRAGYLFGLKKVSELKDLQNAPDAILYGNFPKGLTEDKEGDEVHIKEK